MKKIFCILMSLVFFACSKDGDEVIGSDLVGSWTITQSGMGTGNFGDHITVSYESGKGQFKIISISDDHQSEYYCIIPQAGVLQMVEYETEKWNYEIANNVLVIRHTRYSEETYRYSKD